MIIRILSSIAVLILCVSCGDFVQQEQRAPLGEVWVNLDGTLYQYGATGKFPEDDNGYAEKARFLSIIRREYSESFNNVVIRISPFELDADTPIVSDNVSVTVYFQNGAQLEGKDGAVTLTITDTTQDILTGTFRGRVSNVDFPSDTYAISGSLKIKIERF